jgi:hypothetical protein
VGIIFTAKAWHEPEMEFSLYLGLGFIAYGVWTFIRVRRYAAIVARIPEGESSKP